MQKTFKVAPVYGSDISETRKKSLYGVKIPTACSWNTKYAPHRRLAGRWRPPDLPLPQVWTRPPPGRQMSGARPSLFSMRGARALLVSVPRTNQRGRSLHAKRVGSDRRLRVSAASRRAGWPAWCDLPLSSLWTRPPPRREMSGARPGV